MSDTLAAHDNWAPSWATHPGEHLVDYLEAKGMSQADFARLSGLTPKLVSTIISGSNPVTAETALRFERVLGLKAYFWTGLQARWDLAEARAHHTENVSEEILGQFPIKELQKRQVIDSTSTQSLLESLLSFLGIGSLGSVEAKFATLAVNHRQATKGTTSNYHVLTWLMLGEHAARARQYPEYDRFRFLDAVRAIREMTVLEPEYFGARMVDLLAQSGVALVFEKPITKTCLYGSARWIDGELPVIQMSLRMKTNDHFWWTFFHECAHIYLHQGRTFADDSNGVGDGLEDEADDWAEEILVGKRRFSQFKMQRPRSEIEVTTFAKSINVHSGIVVGMLQHAKVLPYTHLNGLKTHLDIVDG